MECMHRIGVCVLWRCWRCRWGKGVETVWTDWVHLESLIQYLPAPQSTLHPQMTSSQSVPPSWKLSPSSEFCSEEWGGSLRSHERGHTRTRILQRGFQLADTPLYWISVIDQMLRPIKWIRITISVEFHISHVVLSWVVLWFPFSHMWGWSCWV